MIDFQTLIMPAKLQCCFCFKMHGTLYIFPQLLHYSPAGTIQLIIKMQNLPLFFTAILPYHTLIPAFIFPIPIYVYPAGNKDTLLFQQRQSQKIKMLLQNLSPFQTILLKYFLYLVVP